MPGMNIPNQATSDSACKQGFWLLFWASGVVSSLMVYGLLQERIMTLEYNGEAFTWSVFLVFVNRVVAIIFALGMTCWNEESFRAQAPIHKYMIVSLSNVFASTCQYEALKYISFALQTLGKSFKMMPVMLWGMAIGGKRYSYVDWVVALLVTLGISEFIVTEPGMLQAQDTHIDLMRGLFLLGCFLTSDGLTATMQERLFAQHSTSTYNQMMYVNLCSCTVSIITLFLSGELIPALSFTCTHRAFFVDAIVLSASSVAGQFCIYSQVRDFGALVFAATMNVRQVCSIILSYIMYDHRIAPLQVLGLVVTFAALFYKTYSGFMQVKPERQPLKTPDAHKFEDSVDNHTSQKV